MLLCQFLVLVGNRFWFYILLCTWSTTQLWCYSSYFGFGGKQFLVLRTYLHTIQLCGCVSFFVVAGKLILYEYLTNEFVLVVGTIDLIHFEHSICISST